MLSLLINQCGAKASDLPQLVRLTELIRAEKEGAAGGFTVAPTPLATQTPLPPPLSTEPGEVTRVAGQAAKSTTLSVLTSAKDHTALGFLLHNCASPAEQSQCTMLQQLYGLLLPETHEGGASESADGSFSPLRVKPSTAVPVHPATTVAAGAERASHRHHHPVSSDAIATHEQRSDATTTAPLSALLDSAPLLPPSIPVPILPDPGNWEGAVAFYPAATAAPTHPSTPPVPMHLVSAVAVTGIAAVAADRNAMRDGADALRANSPLLPSSSAELPPNDDDEQAERNRESGVVLFPAPASCTDETSAAHATHVEPAAGEGGRAELGAATLPLPRYPPHPSFYAGRMPCPVNEALAARNSATLRLLAGCGATRWASSLSPTSRPTSGPAKRFTSGLYGRASTPRGGAFSSPIPSQQQRYTPHPPQTLPIRGGVEVIRAHRTLSERSLLPVRPAEPWQAWQAVDTVRVSSAQGRVSLLAQDVAPRLRLSTSTPHHHRYQRRVTGAEPPRPPRAFPYNPATISSGVLPCVRPFRRRSSLSQYVRDNSDAPTVEPFADLIVVGARIHLPSLHPTRPRYS
ncbi:hypothetical protein Q4I30_005573 [Leishmania utingensis]|uniref:Uncharacterized protein n=1 Tax=Leishmania utingensis TaxID=653362 RepID=A0AAW3AAE9_9TRYP